MISRFERTALLLLLLLAFSIRYHYAEDELRLPPQNPDGYYYHSLAQNILRDRGYVLLWGTGHEYRLFRPPGYPIFLAAVYSLFGINYFAVRIIEICISCGSIGLVYFIALRLFGKRAAWAAAIIATFYWRAILWTATFRAENLLIFFLLLFIYFLTVERRAAPVAPVAFGGFFFAVACLIRPNTVLCLPLIILWFFTKKKQSLRSPMLASLIFIFAFIAGFCPWGWYIVHERHFSIADSLGTTMGAINVWVANNPEMGDEIGGSGFEKINLVRYAHYSMGEKEWLTLIRTQTRQFILNSPLRCIKMGLLRLKKHWLEAGVLDAEGTILPDTGKNRYGILYTYKDFWKPGTYFRDNTWISTEFKKRLHIAHLWVPLLTFEGMFAIFIVFLLLSMIIHWRDSRYILKEMWEKSSLLILLSIGYVLSSVIGLAHHRIRFPLEWITIVYAGWAISLLISSGRSSDDSSAPGTPGRSHYACLLTAVLIGIAFLSITIVNAMHRNSAIIVEMCKQKPEETQALSYFSRACPDIYRKIQINLPYREVWRYQMEHQGSIDKYTGAVVCWTGEASYISDMPLEQILHEDPPYRRAWEKAGPHATQPLTILLTIGSYDDPQKIGYGQVLIICDKSSASSIKEGDRVSVLAEMGEADNKVMGYIVAFGHSLYRWSIPADI